MRVFNLACAQGHAFEGWFSSSENFDQQLAGSMIACPVCDSTKIEKKLSAPAVLRGGVSRTSAFEEQVQKQAEKAEPKAATDAPSHDAKTTPQISNAMTELMAHPRFAELRQELAKHVRDNTVNVGENFAEEARAMHYNEKPHKNIRGKASREETLELLEEGIEVMPIPFKVDLPDYQ
jgi:hypothetical protein